MEQDLQKRTEAEKRKIEKEQRKLENTMKQLDSKRQKFLKEKNDTEALKRTLLQEKDVFLNRARKGKVDGPTVLKQLEEKCKENAERKQEADVEWTNIKTEREGMKKEEGAIKKERKELEKDKDALLKEREEFAARMAELEEKEAANVAEKERLSVLEQHLKDGEEAVAARGKEYDMLDMKMKDRELIVSKRTEELKTERSQMDDLKKNLYSKLESNKAAFNKQFEQVGAEINKWNSTFDALFANGVGEPVDSEAPEPSEDQKTEAADL